MFSSAARTRARTNWGQSVGAGATLRDTIVHAQSEPLAFAEEPLDADVGGGTVDLPQALDAARGRALADRLGRAHRRARGQRRDRGRAGDARGRLRRSGTSFPARRATPAVPSTSMGGVGMTMRTTTRSPSSPPPRAGCTRGSASPPRWPILMTPRRSRSTAMSPTRPTARPSARCWATETAAPPSRGMSLRQAPPTFVSAPHRRPGRGEHPGRPGQRHRLARDRQPRRRRPAQAGLRHPHRRGRQDRPGLRQRDPRRAAAHRHRQRQGDLPLRHRQGRQRQEPTRSASWRRIRSGCEGVINPIAAMAAPTPRRHRSRAPERALALMALDRGWSRSGTTPISPAASPASARPAPYG